MGDSKARQKFIIKKFLVLIAFALAFLILAVSCNTTIPDDFTSSERLWDSKNMADYNFTLERHCFCPQDRRGPVMIHVRDGIVFSVVYADTGLAANPDFFADADTLDDLFGKVRDAYVNKAERIDVTYDPDFGYPATIYIDVSTQIADEEQGYTVTDFQKIE